MKLILEPYFSVIDNELQNLLEESYNESNKVIMSEILREAKDFNNNSQTFNSVEDFWDFLDEFMIRNFSERLLQKKEENEILEEKVSTFILKLLIR